MSKNQSNKNENKVLKNKRINTGEKGGKVINVESNIPKYVKKRTIKNINNLEIIKKKNRELSEKLNINNNKIKKKKKKNSKEKKKMTKENKKKTIE